MDSAANQLGGNPTLHDWKYSMKCHLIFVAPLLALVMGTSFANATSSDVMDSVSPTNTKQASVQVRMRMSVVIANYIRDAGKSNDFKSGLVDLGATVVEGNWALADWESEDRKLHGQVSFFYLCDSWNVGKVVIARHLRAQDLMGNSLGSVPEKLALRLVADLEQIDKQNVAYLKPGHAELGC